MFTLIIGNSANNNFCSKCFRDNNNRHSMAASPQVKPDTMQVENPDTIILPTSKELITTHTPEIKPIIEKSTISKPEAIASSARVKHLCHTCNKSVGLLGI